MEGERERVRKGGRHQTVTAGLVMVAGDNDWGEAEWSSG